MREPEARVGPDPVLDHTPRLSVLAEKPMIELFSYRAFSHVVLTTVVIKFHFIPEHLADTVSLYLIRFNSLVRFLRFVFQSSHHYYIQ